MLERRRQPASDAVAMPARYFAPTKTHRDWRRFGPCQRRVRQAHVVGRRSINRRRPPRHPQGWWLPRRPSRSQQRCLRTSGVTHTAAEVQCRCPSSQRGTRSATPISEIGSGRHRKELRIVRIAFIYCNAVPTWSYVGLGERTDTAGSCLFAEIRCPHHFMVQANSLLGIGVLCVSRDSGRVRHGATHASRKLAASVSVDRRSASPRRASPTFRRLAEWHRGPISRRAFGPTTSPHPVRRHPTGASAVFRQASSVSWSAPQENRANHT